MDQAGEDENLTQEENAKTLHSYRKVCDEDNGCKQLCTAQEAVLFWKVRRGIREGLGCSGERREGEAVLL